MRYAPRLIVFGNTIHLGHGDALLLVQHPQKGPSVQILHHNPGRHPDDVCIKLTDCCRTGHESCAFPGITVDLFRQIVLLLAAAKRFDVVQLDTTKGNKSDQLIAAYMLINQACSEEASLVAQIETTMDSMFA